MLPVATVGDRYFYMLIISLHSCINLINAYVLIAFFVVCVFFFFFLRKSYMWAAIQRSGNRLNPRISFSWSLIWFFCTVRRVFGFGPFLYVGLAMKVSLHPGGTITVSDNSFIRTAWECCIKIDFRYLNPSFQMAARVSEFFLHSPHSLFPVSAGRLDGEQPSCSHASPPVRGEHRVLPPIPNLGMGGRDRDDVFCWRHTLWFTVGWWGRCVLCKKCYPLQF